MDAARYRLVSMVVATALLAGCISTTPSATLTAPPSEEPASVAPASPTDAPAATSSPVATPSPTAPESPTITEPPTDGPTEAPTLTAPPTATAAATQDPAAWIGPHQVSDNPYTEVDLVVDGDGTVHAAATLGRSIWYVTNRRGGWTREELSSPPGGGRDAPRDIEPTIATGGDRFWVAYTRLGHATPFGALPEDVFLSSGRANNWSAPEPVGRPFANSPSIQVRDGDVHLAYVEGVPFDVVEETAEFPVRYRTNRTGGWTDEVVSRNGTGPVLQLDADGRAVVVIGDEIYLMGGSGLQYAVAGTPTGDFAVNNLPGTIDDHYPHDFALGSDGRMHIAFAHTPEYDVGYQRRTLAGAGEANEIVLDFAYATSVAIDMDASGAAHIVLTTLEHGVWYVTDRGGTFASHELLPPGSNKYFFGTSAIAVDESGRAQVLFAVGHTRNTTRLWHAASPAV